MSSNNKFFSDRFGTDPDVRQSLGYNNVKSYPSVNSSNDGHRHSEENVRWLTKQFIRKPFIIQYDDNTMEEFNYEGSSLNAGTTTGGMVNIDGYIINSAADLNCLSFDNTEDTMLGTGSIYGYIEHQVLQQLSEQFTNGLETADIEDIIHPSGDPHDSPVPNYFRQFPWSTLLPLVPVDKQTQCMWDYIRLSLSYIRKLELNEPYVSSVFIFDGLPEPVPYDVDIAENIGGSTIPTAIRPATVTITYNTTDVLDIIITDLLNNGYDPVESLVTKFPERVNSVTYTTDSVTGNIDSITVEYNCYYGILKDKLKSIKDESDEFTSTLFVVDIFGFYFVYKPDLSISTHTFPYTQDSNINFVQDNITPGRNLPTVYIVKGCNNIYDTTRMYRPIISTDDNYTLLNDHINNMPASYTYTINDFYIKKPEGEVVPALSTSLSNVLNTDHFRIVTETNIINDYVNYNPTDDISVELSRGRLSQLCNNYYCLKLDSSSPILQTFGLKYNNGYTNEYVPVGFMTSSGDLQVLNFQSLYKNVAPAGGVYHSTFIDDKGDTYYQQVYIESYMSFFRRVCAKLYNITISDTGPYGNISRLDEYNNRGWAKIFKDIQYGVLTPSQTDPDVSSNLSAILNFFGVSVITDITFDVLFNKLIAPYMNFYIQLAWSGLFVNTLTFAFTNPDGSPEGNFVARYGLSQIGSEGSEYIVGHSGTDVIYELPRTFNYSGGTIEVSKRVSYGRNSYSDYGRLDRFLYKKNSTYNVTENLYYKEKASFSDGVDKIYWCQDYISYVKSCSHEQWTDTKQHDELVSSRTENTNYVEIPYKITTLDTNSGNTYDGFSTITYIVDRFAYYTGGTDNTEHFNVVPGYIQNVRLATATLIPTGTLPNTWYSWADDIDNKINSLKCPTNNYDYNLSLNHRYSISSVGGQLDGVGGLYFTGDSQGWAISIPTMFKMYKDGQGYLEGRYRGTDKHAGLYIDYKLPMDVQDKDFWFANTWLSPVRTVVTWDIENNGAQYPKDTTDGMTEYLHLRNHTLFSTDVIYNIDEYGNYLSMKDFIQSMINQYAVDLDEHINSQPRLDYIDFVTDFIGDKGKVNSVVTYAGLRDNIERVKQFSEEMSWNTGWVQSGSSNTILIENNKYYDITLAQGSLTVVGRVEDTTGDLNKYNLNTINDSGVTDVATNNVIRTTIKTKFTANGCNLKLHTILNGFTSNYTQTGYGLPVIWDSNYPVTISTELDGTTAYNITIKDPTNPGGTSTCLIELEVHLGANGNTAIGHCNISVIANQNTLTLMDLNYLFTELYKLDSITWSQVSTITKSGFAKRFWKIGDIKTFRVNDGTNTYDVPAMLIGIDSENSHAYDSSTYAHTLTWITNIYNANLVGIETSTVFNTTFNPEIVGTTGKYGYNGESSGNYALPVMNWLNTDVYNTIEPALTNIITPSKKTTGLAYSCSDGVDYRLLKTTYDGTGASNKLPAKLWLPSLSELGLSFTEVDDIEKTIVEGGDTTRSAFTVGNYYVNESMDAISEGVTYPYFQMSRTLQNVKSLTLITSSYYMTDKLLDPSDYDTYIFNLDDYDTIKRVQYVVGTSFNTNSSSARFFTILPKEDVEGVLHNSVQTDFCFITI